MWVQTRFLADQPKARWMATAFVFYGLIATGFLAINVPPFQVPDELAHFLRATQIAGGSFIGKRFSIAQANGSSQITAGGLSDPAVVQAFAPFAGMAGHSNIKASAEDWSPNVHWSETRSLASFPNTVIYPPFFYLPSALGVLAGRIAHLSIIRTLVLSRLLSGVTAVALGVTAIAVADGAAAWIFAILTLPMSLFLFASASQDGLLIACSALAGALMLRLLRWPNPQNRKLLIALVSAISLVGMARPPYGGLALLPLGLGKLKLRWRILASMAIATSVLAWSAVVAATTWNSFGSSAVGAEPTIQLAHLWSEPWHVATVTLATLKHYFASYLGMFIGVLGWGEIHLPLSYYGAGAIALVIAAVAAMLGMKGERVGYSGILLIAVGVFLSVAAVFGIQYLTWTPPDHPIIEGVQGRYFLPIALAGTAMFPALGNARLARMQNWLLVIVLVFPVLSLTVMMRAIVLRYYLH
jgi:uncharacterized membrane protein